MALPQGFTLVTPPAASEEPSTKVQAPQGFTLVEPKAEPSQIQVPEGFTLSQPIAQPVATPTPTAPTDADKFTLAKAKETQDRNERLGLNIIPKAPVVASTSPTKSSFDTKSLTDLGYETDPNKQLLKTMVGDVTTPNTKVMDKRYELAQQSMEYAKKQANIAADQAKKSGAPDADVKTIFEDTYSKSLSPVSGISAADAEYQIQSDYRMRPEMKGITETAQGLKRAGALGYHALAQAGGGQLRFMQDMLGIDSSNTAESLDKINKTVEAIGTPTSHPQAIIEGAISSILQQAPAMGMGVATGSEIPVLGSMFLNSFGQTYDDSRRKGLDTVDSTIRSGAYATLEVLGEKLGLDEFMKGLKASAKGVPASKLSEYFTDALLKQLPGEELTYMGQFAVDKGYGLNPKAGIKDFFDGAIDTMGATLIQGGLMFGGAHAVNSVANAKNTPKDYQDQLAQATKDSAMQQWQMMREGKPLQPRATVQKDILAKASELTTAEEQPATTEVLAPEVTVPTEARIEPTLGEPTPVVPATEAEQHAELVKKYRDKGQTAENALLLANLEIEDKKELENAGRTDTGPTGVSAPISGPTIAGGTTGGTEQPVGTTMAGVGSTAGTTATGTTVQPSTLSPTIAPLYTAMQESGKDFKNPIQVRKFLEKTVFGGDTALFEDTLKLAPNLVKDLFTEWKTPVQAAPEVTTPTEVVGETPTAPTVEAPQEATPTPTAEDMHIEESIALAKDIREQLNPADPIEAKKIEQIDAHIAKLENTDIPNTLANVNGFMEDFYAKTSANLNGSRERIYNNEAGLEVSPTEDNTIHIHDIRSFAPNKLTGAGSRALKTLTTLADEHGVTLEGTAQAHTPLGLSDDQLKSWYEKNGFTVDDMGNMERKPKGIPKQEVPSTIATPEEDAIFEKAKDVVGAFVRQTLGNTESIAPEDIVSAQQALASLADIMYHVIKTGARNFTQAMADARQGLGQYATAITDKQFKDAYDAAKARIKVEPKVVKAKKAKINKAVQTLATSKNAEEVKSALTELMDSPTWENAKDIVKSTLETATVVSLPATLPMLSTSQIIDIIGDRIPHLDEVAQTVDKMIVMRSKMMAQTAHILQPWSKFAVKHTKAGALLSDVMILSTLTSVDPTLHNTLAEALQDDDKLVNLRAQVASAVSPRSKAAYTGQITTRVSDINEVYNIWNKLANVANGEGQEIYKVVKDHFETIYNLYRAILNERINALNIPGDINDASTPKGKLMAAIKLSYEGAKKIGVYFPLMRTGEYWMNEGTGANDPFYMFESQWERDRFYRQRIKAMQKAGDTRTADEIHAAGDIDKGNKAEDIRSKIEASSTMLKDIFEIIDAQKPLVSTGTSKEAAIAASQQRDDLKDSIYQLYLLTMPESSFRKRYLHRKGKAGFSTDNIRNFATHGFTTANQLSRLKYSPVLINLMESAKAAIQGGPHDAKLEVYLDEIGLRVKDEIAPVQATSNLAKTFNTGASITNQVAFIWSLTSIKSAFNNMTALSVYGLPVLSAHYGAGPAFKAMAKYGAVWNHTTFITPDGNYTPLSVGLSKHVQSNPVLAAAFEEAFEQGVTEITRAFDIISQSNTPSAAHQNAISRGRRIAIGLHTALFHHSERLNREIMYMADFELGYAKNIKDGMFPGIGMAAYNKAVDDAVKHTYESMFNYSRFNRPRIMRPAGMRVITQFEFFPQQACGYLIKNVITALPLIKSNTAKKEAATKLFGTLLMTYMWGGLVALPLFSMAIGLIKKWLQSDDDEAKKAGIHIFENKDPKLWFTTVYLPQTFGNDTNFAKVFGEHNWNLVLERGPISTATNVDFGASTSLDNLFFRDTKYNPSLGMSFDNYWNALKGPGINKYEDFVKAIDDYNTGHFKEMLDKILPPLERGAFDTYTWATKGIISKNDSLKVMDKHEITFGMLAAKAAGFNPLNVARITQRNFAVEQLNAEAKDKRSKVMSRIDLELARKDTKAFQKAIKDAIEFSAEYPDLEITGDSIASSLVKKAKIRAMAQNGLIIDVKSYPKLYNIIKSVKPNTTKALEQAKYDAMVKAEEADKVPDEEPMEIEINGGQ